MTSTPAPPERATSYEHRALTALAGAWMRPKPNRSGMRAAFRRWQPDISRDPTMEMRQYIWGWLGSPDPAIQGDEEKPASGQAIRTVRRAAILVALRAAAGDHPGTYVSIGAALYDAGLTDLRLMRLLTAPRSARLQSLHRVLRLLDSKGLGVRWTEAESNRVLDFIDDGKYSDDHAQRSATKWASDFFARRGKTVLDSEMPSPAINTTIPSSTEN